MYVFSLKRGSVQMLDCFILIQKFVDLLQLCTELSMICPKFEMWQKS